MPSLSLLKKIKSPDALKKTLSRTRKKVVFTNGCFDILHPGHVLYLEKAKKQGATLVVALDTDASVRKLKGSSRPINKLEDRMRVIAALESVDYVTWFSGGDPRELICKLRPKILVKGGDWKTAEILGNEEVRSWGGKVKSLPFVKGKSTSRIIQRSKTSKTGK